MTDSNTGGDDKPVTVEALQEQIANLNKGIASYRDTAQTSAAEAKTAKAEMALAKAEIAEIKKAIEEAKEDEGDDKDVTLAANDQKKLEKWAKENGFVTKAEMEVERNRLFTESIQNIEKQAVEEFLKAHSEYDDDKKWNAVKEQFQLYKQPTSLTAYKQLLNKIHRELTGDDDSEGRARAQRQSRERLGAGGGSQKGDDDGDAQIEKMMEKYPHLSRDVIVDRLDEINKLTAARDAKRKAGKK